MIKSMMRLLRAELCGETAERVDVSDFRSLYSLSKHHDLAHVVGRALRRGGAVLDAELTQKFQKQETISAFRYMRSEHNLERACAALENAGIRHMPLKGSVIRAYYPAPEMRTSCDIDILVDESELERAIAVFRDGLHFEIGQKDYHDVSIFSDDGVHIELHFNLIDEDPKIDPFFADIWEHSVPVSDTKHRFVMNHEYFVFYCIAHMAKHVRNGGCGIRPFMDLWICERKMGYDRKAVETLLHECGLARFGEAAFHLTEVWFGEEEHTALTAELESYILGGGVYGTMENKVGMSQAKREGKLRYALHRIFLPRRQLAIAYPKVEKHGILLPYYQVKRWFRILFGGSRKNAVRELKYSSSLTEETRIRLTSLYSGLGLE